jgi:hypothetical protein
MMKRLHTDMPKGVLAETRVDGLAISWPTLGGRWGFLVVAVLMLFIFLFIIIGVFIAPLSYRQWDFGDVITMIIGILFYLGVSYFAAVGLFNRSTIEISRDVLRTRCGPIPYMRAKSISTASVRQVYVSLRMRRGRYRHYASYGVCALTTHGWSKRLVEVYNGNIALYLEQEIEQFLGIPDEVVRGEWRPEPYLWS